LVISGDERKRKDNVAVTRVSSFRRRSFTNAIRVRRFSQRFTAS
jgi:hypothetical protein